MRARMAAAAFALAGAAVAGCSDTVTTSEAMLITTVVIDDTAYHPAARLAPEQEVGERYTEVTRFVDCSDGVWVDGALTSDSCPLRDGESNYLPAGTPIFRIVGVEPLDGLVVEHAGEWEVLRPAGWQPAGG